MISKATTDKYFIIILGQCCSYSRLHKHTPHKTRHPPPCQQEQAMNSVWPLLASLSAPSLCCRIANLRPRRRYWRSGTGHGIAQERHSFHSLRRCQGVLGGRVSATPKPSHPYYNGSEAFNLTLTKSRHRLCPQRSTSNRCDRAGLSPKVREDLRRKQA